MLSNDVTILVNSCDAYADCWEPFFKLWKAYWPDSSCKLILNTESKAFQMDGLDITCLQLYKPGEKIPYGERMIAHLQHIQTPYVLTMMDDFFLRAPVDMTKVAQCLSWLKSDPLAAQFYFTQCVDDWNIPAKSYPGFIQKDHICPYKCNMMPGIWKKEVLEQYWVPEASPWEWEYYCTFRTFLTPHKFYALSQQTPLFMDIGNRRGKPWGVVRGKWVLEDVQPLFQAHNIEVDYAHMGIYPYEEMIVETPSIAKAHLKQLIGSKNFRKLNSFTLKKRIFGLLHIPFESDFISYLRKKQKTNDR